jgi:hypothetical protein
LIFWPTVTSICWCKRFAWSWWYGRLFCRFADTSESCRQDSIWRAAQDVFWTSTWYMCVGSTCLLNLHTCNF